MRRKSLGHLFALLIALLVAIPVSASTSAGKPITIATGGETGVYFAVGEAICRLLNRDLPEHGEPCQAATSSGGVANVRTILNHKSTFAVMQSSHHYKALNGMPPFEESRNADNLRVLFSLHDEVFTVIARADAAVHRFDDLKGKRLNIGAPGSGQRDALEEILQLKGWQHADFAMASELESADQASALGDRNIDAMIYFAGHPNSALKEASSVIDARVVAVQGKAIDQLLASKPYYTRASVPGGLYRGNPDPMPSVGTRAVFAATSKVDAETVYRVVKEVFENLDRIRHAHPALVSLDEQQMLQAGHQATLHEGALRYYRERGWLSAVAN